MSSTHVVIAIGSALILLGVPAVVALIMSAQRSRQTPAELDAFTDSLLGEVHRVARDAFSEQSEHLVRLAEAKYENLQQGTDRSLDGHSANLTAGLAQLDARIGEVERSRSTDHGHLSEALRQVNESNERTRIEASNLATAMKGTSSRGLWGEMQLQRVCELAGMTEHVDYERQIVATGQGSALRPDALVNLPGGRSIIVDSKAPLAGFLEACEATEPEPERAELTRFATAVHGHVRALAKRDYPSAFGGAIDMVVLFLPGDCFLSAALQHRPQLLEEAAQLNVVLASPSSLIMIMRGASHAWREQRFTQEALEIARLARQLHERIGTYASHIDDVGTHLRRSVEAYNRAAGSFETRLMPAVRQLESCGAQSTKTIAQIVPVAETPRVADVSQAPLTLLQADPVARPSSRP